MSDATLPILTLVVGAMLGLGSSLLGLFLTHRRTIALRLLDQFFAVRKELVEAVSPLSNLSSTEQCGIDELIAHRAVIATLYYKHFDFLPAPVTDALVLLHAALTKPSRGPYSLQQGTIVTLNDADLIPFVDKCSRFENTKFFTVLALKSKHEKVRVTETIKLHARYVLYTLNKYASIQELSKLTTALRKLH